MLVHTPKSLKGTKGNVAWFDFHGGGAIGGSPDLHSKPCSYTAAHLNVIVFNPTYRLAGEGTAEQMAGDGVASLKHVIDKADEYGIDASKIVLAGCSGGGFAVTVTCSKLAT